jgi:hypothetical protein
LADARLELDEVEFTQKGAHLPVVGLLELFRPQETSPPDPRPGAWT